MQYKLKGALAGERYRVIARGSNSRCSKAKPNIASRNEDILRVCILNDARPLFLCHTAFLKILSQKKDSISRIFNRAGTLWER